MFTETERAKDIDAAVKAADAKKRADAEAAEHHGEKLDVLLSTLNALGKRMDAYDEEAKRGFEKQQLPEGDSEDESDGLDLDDPDKPLPLGADSRKRRDTHMDAWARADAEELEAYKTETGSAHARADTWA